MSGSLAALPLVVALLLFIRIKLKSTKVAGIMNMWWWVSPLAKGTFIEYSIQCLISLWWLHPKSRVWIRMYYSLSITVIDIKVSIRCILVIHDTSHTLDILFSHRLLFSAPCYVIGKQVNRIVHEVAFIPCCLRPQ